MRSGEKNNRGEKTLLVSLEESEQIKAAAVKGHCLLLGITGGIASGKSTVTRMLQSLGAPLIDFDVLSRLVVEPEKPAWKDIVEFFGKDILLPDQSLDRKKLSDIVFRHPKKRKRLEGFTHPRILELFVRRIKEIVGSTPGVIIQVDIPLMIESGLYHMFHRIVLVYASRELQIERMIRRDGISKEKALQILNAQMPLDDKINYVDFVIRNDGPLESARTQVEDVWKTLKQIQAESPVSSGI